MNIQKSAVERSLRSSRNNDLQASRIDKDLLPAEKAKAVKEVVQQLEKQLKANRDLLIVVISE